MNNLKNTFILFCLFFLASDAFIPTTANSSSYKKSLSIDILPEINIFKQRARFEGIASLLSTRMGIEAKLNILTYGNVIEKMRKGEVDGTFLDSFVGDLAISQLGAEPLVRPLNNDGPSTYKGLIITRKDSNIRTIEEMKDQSLAPVEETTAGFFFPLALFRQHGVNDLEAFSGKQFISGSHDRIIALVLNDQADISAVKNTVYISRSQWQRRVNNEL